MKSTLIMAVLMAFAFVGCQPKVQELNVKNEKVTANSENWDITVNRSMFSSADANVNKSCEVLNKKIEKFVNDLQDSLKSNANEFFQSWQESGGKNVLHGYTNCKWEIACLWQTTNT